MAKTELFAIPGLGPLITATGAYPVDRSKGDVAAIKRSVAMLKEGEAIGIFPEGTRNRDGGAKVRSGVALLASLSGAPIVPAFVSGAERASRLGRITVAFGEPLALERSQKAKRDDLAKWSDLIMTRIQALGETLGGN